MTNPLVSVIIPAYNSAQFVRQAIDSVLAQTYQPIEIIVVNDGSTDTTEQELADYESRPSIRLITQTNRGLAGARNTGIIHANGEFIAFLDADDVWVPQKIERQVRLIQSDPRIGLVLCNWRSFQADHPDHKAQLEKKLPAFLSIDQIWLDPNVGGGSGGLVRRSIIETIGRFNESLRQCEDFDLWLRVANSFRVAWISEPLFYRRIHRDSMTRNLVNNFKFEKQVREMSLKQFPGLAQEITTLKTNAAFAQSHVNAAVGYMFANEPTTARSECAQALQYRPGYWKAYVLKYLTFLGPKWFKIFFALRMSL